MSLVVLEGVSLFFGERPIVDNLGLRIGAGEHVGLVGPNGSGKTTLLRMLVGEQGPDQGQIRRSKGLRIGYLPQDITAAEAKPLLQSVLESVPGKGDIEDQISAAERELAALSKTDDHEGVKALSARLSDLHEHLAHLDMHYAPHEALRILIGLGFSPDDRNRPLTELSGGWRMRALLASLLFQRPDLLALDEPTNHLDLPSVAWFANFLKHQKSAFVLISHDREFLNDQVGRVVSFEPEGVRAYSGNYESYLKQRAEEEVVLENKARNIERERHKAEQFIERFRAKASKAASVQSRVKTLEKLEDVELFKRRAQIRLRFPPCERAGAEALGIRALSKSYGSRPVLRHLDLSVRRGERIGIIGVNGAGKTTLLRTMAGELDPSAGSVEIGYNVKLGYYAQHHADMLTPRRTVLEEVQGQNPDASVSRVRSLLGAFLFSGDTVDKKVQVLSGGEKARVALARLLINPGNAMLMDEPTNHLDLDSSEALAEALSTYDGTLVFVSHNLSFIRRLATRIWHVEGGTVETYPGTLDEYMRDARARADALSAQSSGLTSSAEPRGAKKQTQSNEEGKPAKRSRAEEKERKRREAAFRAKKSERLNPLKAEIQELEERIETLEQKQATLSEKLEDPATYQDPLKCAEISKELKKTANDIDAATTRWATAQEELEEAEEQFRDGPD